MRPFFLPRLGTVDLFAAGLLASVGITLGAGCSSEVIVDDGTGGGGTGGDSSGVTHGSTGSTSSNMTTSVGSTTGSMTTTGVTTGGGTGGCVNPVPVIVNGQDTGLDKCDGGQFRRREALECPTNYPDTNPCCGGCPEGQVCNTQGEVACTCVAACTNDSECGAGQVCMCGDPAGVCVGATCATGDDCGAGQECTSWDSSLGCLYLAFACTTPVDTCGGDADCDFSPNYFCGLQPDGHRECMPGGCAIGRPFLVDGDARTAPLATRADWLAELATPTPALDGLPPELRARLARAWERTAKMEHASIAAFARFSLQLLALGAPAELVERTNAAMVDETRHARVAYALASAYGGAPVGPGPLAIDGALASASLADVVRLVVREGCIGETVAAIEAGEAAARATDPVVRSVLETIARDEASHAELAWRFIAWALRTKDAAACAVIHDEIALLRASSEHGALGSLASLAADDERMLDHGIATDGARAIIRGHALRSIVMPCLGALIDEATAPRRYDEGAVVSSRAPV